MSEPERYVITVDIEESLQAEFDFNRRLVKDMAGDLVERLHGGRVVFSVECGDEYLIEKEVVE